MNWHKPARGCAVIHLRLINTCHAVPMPCCAVAWRSRFQIGVVGPRHGHGVGTAWHVSITLYCQHLGVVSRKGKLARILYFSSAVLHCVVSPKQDSGSTVLCSVFLYLCFRNPTLYDILVYVYYSRTALTRTLVIRIGNFPDRLRPSVNLSRILQNYLALKLRVIWTSTVQCYGFNNFKSGLVERFTRRYIL